MNIRVATDYSVENSANDSPDPREIFLVRASARDRLFVAGEMTLDDAFDGLVPAMLAIIDPRPPSPTDAARKTAANFDRLMRTGGPIDAILRRNATDCRYGR